MKFLETKLKDVFLIKPQVFQDERGFFLESYSKKEFSNNGIKANFVQDNYSKSIRKGTLRGLHFQLPPYAQAKLVRVTKGSVFDIVLDLRKKSPTFSKWQSFYLSEKNFLILFIPKGFAHGFCTLEKETEFEYKCDNFYNPQNESGIIWNDPMLKINWPIKKPILSEKDKKQQSFENFLKNNPF